MSVAFTNISAALIFMLCALFPQSIFLQTDQNPAAGQVQQTELVGAWKLAAGNAEFANLPEGATAVALLEDGYFTVTYYSPAAKNFIGTYGGTYDASNGNMNLTFEYNTLDDATVGNTYSLSYTLKDGQLQINGNGQQNWTRIAPENTTSPLEGTWRITGRAGEDGEISPMQRGPRKTLKVLSDGRFQWIAFNTATKEFSGTGGGTYTAENGKYTETIDFFSRDSSRVGANLGFNYEVKDGKWHHSGKSSTGKDIYEIWGREH
ncbi:membrane or secreted protein [Pontibacter russatus]|uniref:membrane or secreted protein n=1 Tax=Pontibacter russatus TaxID=2694929 RepID=UPI001F47EC00|nr:membrane or secreted protein [Pontibacter russatus]